MNDDSAQKNQRSSELLAYLARLRIIFAIIGMGAQAAGIACMYAFRHYADIITGSPAGKSIGAEFLNGATIALGLGLVCMVAILIISLSDRKS